MNSGSRSSAWRFGVRPTGPPLMEIRRLPATVADTRCRNQHHETTSAGSAPVRRPQREPGKTSAQPGVILRGRDAASPQSSQEHIAGSRFHASRCWLQSLAMPSSRSTAGAVSVRSPDSSANHCYRGRLASSRGRGDNSVNPCRRGVATIVLAIPVQCGTTVWRRPPDAASCHAWGEAPHHSARHVDDLHGRVATALALSNGWEVRATRDPRGTYPEPGIIW